MATEIENARELFRALADPITAELKKQGLDELTAGMLAGNLVQAQLDSFKNKSYGMKFYTKEMLEDEENKDS